MHTRDQWRLAFFLCVGALCGLALGSVGWGLFAGCLWYVLRLQQSLGELLAWLRNRKENEPPEQPGILEALSLEIDFLRERHKKRKKRLGSYIKQFRRATRALPDATLLLGEDDTIVWANEAAARDLGIRWPEDVDQRITNLVRLPALVDYIESSRNSPSTLIDIPSPVDDQRRLSVLTAPVGDNERLMVARDVTRLHRANQVRSDFVANVSHELRTPLTVLKGYVETLTAQADVCPPAWRPALRHMTVHVERMQSLTEELLLLSRLESEDRVAAPEFVDVPELISEIQQRTRELNGAEEHMIALDIDGDLCLLGARQELYSAFANLVFNAVRYTPDRGVIKIRWYRDAEGAHFSVEDNGVGIAPEHLPRLTERFYRVDASRNRDGEPGGTGLGLAIVKHVLARHDGRLRVTSVVGRGSCFIADFAEGGIVSRQATQTPLADRDAS